jgi:hypothetical protein
LFETSSRRTSVSTTRPRNVAASPGELAGIITALGSLAGAITAGVLAAKGRRDARRDQEAANRLRDRQAEQDYWKTQATDQRVQMDRWAEAEEKARLKLEAERAESDRLRERLLKQERDCETSTDSLMDTLRTIRGVVHDEIAKEAGDRAISRSLRHLSEHGADG